MMQADLSGYDVLDYHQYENHDLSPAEARRWFKTLMDIRHERIDQLAQLVARNGLVLDDSNEHLTALEDWMLCNVEPEAGQHVPTTPWRSICRDVGLYLGERAIARNSHLRWIFVATGKTFEDYRQPAISGFTNVQDHRYRAALCAGVFSHAVNSLNYNRVEVADIGGTMMTFELGPVRNDLFVRILRGIDELA